MRFQKSVTYERSGDRLSRFPALRADAQEFQRMSQHLVIGALLDAFGRLFHGADRAALDIREASAMNAADVMMLFRDAVVATLESRHIDFAGEADLAQRLQISIHRGEIDCRAFFPHEPTQFVRCGMGPRSLQFPENDFSLWCHPERVRWIHVLSPE